MKKSVRRALYRPIIEPNIPLPFGVRSVGHYKQIRPTAEHKIAKHFLELFWAIAGEGVFRHNGRNMILKPGEIFIYLPGDMHDIETLSMQWEYRWFTIDGVLNKTVVESFGLRRELRFSGACPEELFMELEQGIHDISPFGQRANVATAMKILAYACGVREAIGDSLDLVGQSLKIIKEQYFMQELNVSLIAGKLGVHRTTISRLFKEKMGISPVQFLNSYRIQKALSMLKETILSVQEVAEQNGFDDPNYFCKVVKKATGYNPTDFRTR